MPTKTIEELGRTMPASVAAKVKKSSPRETTAERRARLGRESVSAKAAQKTATATVKVSVPALGETRTTEARAAFARLVVSTREPKGGAKVAWSAVASDKKVLAAAKVAGIDVSSGALSGSVLRRAYYVGGGKRRADR